MQSNTALENHRQDLAARVVVMGMKGGVGKSTVASVLATLFGFPILTNDFWSPLIKTFNKDGKKRMIALEPGEAIPALPKELPCIFDAGGYADPRLEEMINQSQCVIVPTYTTKNDIETMLQTLKQVSKYTNNVIVVANKASKSKKGRCGRREKSDLEGMKNLLSSIPAYTSFKVVELSDAPIYERVLNEASCITEMRSKLVLKHKFLSKTLYRNQIKEVEILAGSVLSFMYSEKAAT